MHLSNLFYQYDKISQSLQKFDQIRLNNYFLQQFIKPYNVELNIYAI